MSSFEENAWLETPLGLHLLQREQAYHDQVVANIFGFNALQLGLLSHDLLRTSRIPRAYGPAWERQLRYGRRRIFACRQPDA